MARRPINRLTAREVQTIRASGRHADGAGLYLQVDPSGARRWVFVFQFDRRRKEMGLGPVDIVSLAQAREERGRARRMVFEGVNPIEQRRRSRAEIPTFAELAEEVIAGLPLSNEKHRAQWRTTLIEYSAELGPRQVNDIDTADVLQVLKPRWAATPETAARMRGRIERVLDAAKAKGFREGENPARWRGHLALLMPRQKRAVRHHAALPYKEVSFFMRELRRQVGVGARALEFTILTAARTGETMCARWEEIDLQTATWTIPASRMKAGREHRVPLTEAALAVLRPIRRPAGYVFLGSKADRPISNMTMQKVLRAMGRDVTVHGFRSTFRDWVGESTNFPRDLAEAALAHVVGDATERAYRRGDALEKRRKLMEAWAGYCERVVSAGDSKRAA